MPAILNHIAAITTAQFIGRVSGGFSVALNLGQFALIIAFIPIFVIVATYDNAFIICGCLAFLFALPYLLVIIKEKYGLHP